MCLCVCVCVCVSVCVRVRRYSPLSSYLTSLHIFVAVFNPHNSMTYTPRSLTRVSALFARVAFTHTGPRVVVSSAVTFLESPQNSTPANSGAGCKTAYHVTVTHPCGDHVRLCLT